MKKKTTVRIVNATEAKNRFGELIKHAYLDDEHLIVKRDGIPVVAIVPIADYERMVSPEDLPTGIAEEIEKSARRARAHTSMRAFLEDVHSRMPDVSEEETNAEISEAIREVRAHK